VSSEGRTLLRRLRRRKTAYLATRIRDLPPQDLRALARATEVLESILARDADGETA
jgi:hypothetical protein